MDRKDYCVRALEVLVQLLARINSSHKGNPLFYIYSSLFTSCSVHGQRCNLFTHHDEPIIGQKALSIFFFKYKMLCTSFGKVKLHKDPLRSPSRVLVLEILPCYSFFF